MMVLWEKKSVNVKSLGEHLYLDSGTLTPLLKKMETNGLVTRERSMQDERNVMITITDEGEKLKERAKGIPEKVGACIPISKEDSQELYRLLYKMLGQLSNS